MRFYNRINRLINVYDNIKLDNDMDLEVPQFISSHRYEIIFKAIYFIALNDCSFDSYQEYYYYLVNKQLKIYKFLENEKKRRKKS